MTDLSEPFFTLPEEPTSPPPIPISDPFSFSDCADCQKRASEYTATQAWQDDIQSKVNILVEQNNAVASQVNWLVQQLSGIIQMAANLSGPKGAMLKMMTGGGK